MNPFKHCFSALLAAVLIIFAAGCEIDNTGDLTFSPQDTATESGGETSGTPAGDTSDSSSEAAQDNVADIPITSGSGVAVRGQGGGFLWKPVSESDGNLVVLLPSSYNGGRVQLCYIEDSAGTILEVGSYRGDGNGDRPHYRFDRPGGSYGDNLRAMAEIEATGELHYWPVTDGAARVEY